jgi:transposase
VLRAVFECAEALGLIDERPEGALDATGLESRHASSYYVNRKGYRPFRRRGWPKLTLCCHTGTHLFPSAVVSAGPSNDSPQFAAAMILAAEQIAFDRLLADAAYDGEHNHRLCREQLGIRSTVIPLNPRRSCSRPPRGRYRRQMSRRFPKRVYAHRWQVESAISQLKRILGSAVRARSEAARSRECLLRVLTHNLMLLALFLLTLVLNLMHFKYAIQKRFSTEHF